MDDMHLLIDDHTAERLVSGSVAPDDAPPGYARLAALVRAARAPGAPDELVGGGAVAAMAAAIVANTLAPATARTLPGSTTYRKISRLVSAKAAALATVALFGLGTAAAAATGALPTQGSNHGTTSLEIASSSGAGSGTQLSAGSSTSGGSGSAAGSTTVSSGSTTINAPMTGPANQHALFGLCTAFLAGPTAGTATTTGTGTTPGGKDNSTAFRALISEAGGSVSAATATCTAYLQGHSGSSSASTSGVSSTDGPSTDTGSGRPSNPGNAGSHGHGQASGSRGAGARGQR